jgi:hypothetical protein
MAGYKNIPGLRSVAALGLHLLGPMRQGDSRQAFQTPEKRSQLAMLLDCGTVERSHFWVEL